MGEKSGIIKGKAFYRERIALPPGAVFEAVLEDVSRQDIEAREIGRTVDEDAKGPPYVFSIAYDTADIDPRLSYAVRTMIRVDGKLKFTTDMIHPVLTRGAGSEVEIMMKMVHGQPPIMPKEATEIMGGEISYEGDEAFFTDALTGRRHELASDGDRERLDSAYHDGSRDEVRALYVTFEGRVDGGKGQGHQVHQRLAEPEQRTFQGRFVPDQHLLADRQDSRREGRGDECQAGATYHTEVC
jgi:uncharacterized lipoprotein YbaY